MAIRNLRKPYLLVIGDMPRLANAKTAFGLRDWAREDCIGQLRFNDEAVDLGLPQLSPREAAAAGARTAVIGITPLGGQLPESWLPTLLDILSAGLDLASGLHQRLSSIPELATCAARLGRQLHDVRHADTSFPVADGKPRSGRRLLTVGTDCALGKKYTALAITRAMKEAGYRVDFRATGQTGILISGSGVAVDAVVSDFVAGAAEALSPANDANHWDIIEGQGSLFHPAYAGVTLGLLHGSQPDALVLCHKPTRKTIYAYPHVPIVQPQDAMPAYEAAARLTNPRARFVAISLDTSDMSEADAASELRRTGDACGLPCIDPIRTGVAPIVAKLRELGLA